MTTKYKVLGMTCGGCAASVTRAILALAPAAKVDVDLAQGIVSVDGVDDEQVIDQAVVDAGFSFEGRAQE